jgi:hypothetical protein
LKFRPGGVQACSGSEERTPSVGVNPPGPTTDPFAPEAVYELKIDTDGDVVADIAYRVRVSSSRTGRRPRRCVAFRASRLPGQATAGRLSSMAHRREARVTEAGDYRFFVGWRSEPFFFDTQGALNNLQFTGHDFFADSDVCSIVWKYPILT